MEISTLRKLLCSIIFLAFLLAIQSCEKAISPEADKVDSINFKTEVPFEIRQGKIIVQTDWGVYKVKKYLIFDTHAPSSADKFTLTTNKSVNKLNTPSYKLKTVDGTEMIGDIYECDSVKFGTVKFSRATFYDMPQIAIQEWNKAATSGVFGDNLISKGVWKIDFRRHALTFASTLDSIADISDTVLIPSKFVDNNISFNVIFGHGIEQSASLDLGYNGCFIIPMSLFRQIDTNNKIIADTEYTSVTAVSSFNAFHYSVPQSIKIHDKYYLVNIVASEHVQEILVGLAFFSSFEYLLIDYGANLVYVSKRMIQPFDHKSNY